MQKGSDNARLVLQTKAACQQFTVRRSSMGFWYSTNKPTGSAEICKRVCPPSQSSSPSIGSTNQRSKLHLSSTGRTSEYVLSTNFLDSRCPFLSWLLEHGTLVFKVHQKAELPGVLTRFGESFSSLHVPPARTSLFDLVLSLASAPLFLATRAVGFLSRRQVCCSLSSGAGQFSGVW